jgi:hypothetical protein
MGMAGRGAAAAAQRSGAAAQRVIFRLLRRDDLPQLQVRLCADGMACHCGRRLLPQLNLCTTPPTPTTHPGTPRQEDCADLFIFGKDVKLSTILEQPERWYCVAAVPAGGDGRVVGFVAAAIGRVSEFPQEAALLATAIDEQRKLAGYEPIGSSSGSAEDGGGASSSGSGVSEASAGAASTSGSGSGSSGSSGGGSDDLVAEVVLLGVLEDWRRQRVATRLLGRVRAFARSRECAAMCLHAQVSWLGSGDLSCAPQPHTPIPITSVH